MTCTFYDVKCSSAQVVFFCFCFLCCFFLLRNSHLLYPEVMATEEIIKLLYPSNLNMVEVKGFLLRLLIFLVHLTSITDTYFIEKMPLWKAAKYEGFICYSLNKKHPLFYLKRQDHPQLKIKNLSSLYCIQQKRK